jgi:lipid-binding SYLF domain-containing protein
MVKAWIATTLLLVVGLVGPFSQRAEAATAQEINRDSREALQKLYAISPAARAAGRNAKAVLVFPKVVKGGFIFGAHYGQGALLAGNRTLGFFSTSAANYGFQIGGQRYAYAVFFMTKDSLKNLSKTGGWEIGTDPNVVLIDTGAGAQLTSTSLGRGVYSFVFNQKGLMAGVSIQGSKITPINPRK